MADYAKRSEVTIETMVGVLLVSIGRMVAILDAILMVVATRSENRHARPSPKDCIFCERGSLLYFFSHIIFLHF